MESKVKTVRETEKKQKSTNEEDEGRQSREKHRSDSRD